MSQTILDKKYPFRKEYDASKTIYENDENKVNINFIAVVERFDSFRYRIKRKDILINNKPPDLVVEQVSEKVGNIFSLLEVEILENGNLKNISNLDEIYTRWKNLKTEFREYYDGKGAQEIVKTTDNELKSKSEIQNRILNSLFYRLYFLPFSDYIKNKDTDLDLYLPVFPYKNKVKYRIKTEKFELSENGKMIMRISGECSDPRSMIQIINNRKETAADQKKCSGKVELIYQFNKEDGSVFSINSEIVLQSEDKENERRIIFELNQINTK